MQALGRSRKIKEVKTLIFSIFLLSAPSCFASAKLSVRLWKELEMAKHKSELDSTQSEKDLAWLNEYESNIDQTDQEDVDQVMAEFNKTPAKQPQNIGQEDSVSFGMAGLQKTEAAPPKKKQKNLVKERSERPYSMTRSRNR